jgi:hypothetical protein
MKVIGAGFGRTGTLSVKAALEELGVGPCYHMVEVFDKPRHVALWQAAAEGKSIDWEAPERHECLPPDGPGAHADLRGCMMCAV